MWCGYSHPIFFVLGDDEPVHASSEPIIAGNGASANFAEQSRLL
jgi:hypothetical protein